MCLFLACWVYLPFWTQDKEIWSRTKRSGVLHHPGVHSVTATGNPSKSVQQTWQLCREFPSLWDPPVGAPKITNLLKETALQAAGGDLGDRLSKETKTNPVACVSCGQQYMKHIWNIGTVPRTYQGYDWVKNAAIIKDFPISQELSNILLEGTIACISVFANLNSLTWWPFLTRRQ